MVIPNKEKVESSEKSSFMLTVNQVVSCFKCHLFLKVLGNSVFLLDSNEQFAINIFLQLEKEKLKRDKDINGCYFLHSFYATHTTHYPLLPLQKKDSKYIYKSQDSLAASKLLTTQ